MGEPTSAWTRLEHRAAQSATAPVLILVLDLDALAHAVRDSRIPVHEIAWPLGLDAGDIVDAVRLRALAVADIVRVAERVGLPLATLFRDPEQGAPPDDVARLGACLAGRGEGAPRSCLAMVLGWDLTRLERAARQLRRRLAPLGLALVGREGRLSIARLPGVVDPEQIAALARGLPPGGAVEASVATMIWYAVFLGDRIRIGSGLPVDPAYRQGLVDLGERGDYRVADSVAFSLMLTE